MAISPLNAFGTLGTSPASENYLRGITRNGAGTAVATAKGDTVSISAEAFGMQQQTKKVKSEQELAIEQLEDMDAFSFMLNGEEVDIVGRMQEIARQDFGKYLDILEKLKSTDPVYFLDGLADIFDVTRGEMQQAIGDMTDEKLRELSLTLGKITGRKPDEVLDMFYQINDLQTLDN